MAALAKGVFDMAKSKRYVEHILTGCATCRLQGRSVIDYLREACRCHSDGIAVLLL